MTRNNFSEQLSWLLANPNLLLPNAPRLPPAPEPISRESSPRDETVYFTPTTGRSPTSRPNDTAAIQLYPALPRESSRTSTSVVDRAVVSSAGLRENRKGDAATANMGRLVSNTSSKRPNLTLFQEQLHSPASTINTTTGASLSSDYPAFLAKNSTKKKNASPEPRPERVPPMLAASFSTSRVVDIVDLTNGRGQSASFPTTFGNDNPLWRNGVASRPELVTSSGKNLATSGSNKTISREDHNIASGPIPIDDDSFMFDSDIMEWEQEALQRPEPPSTKHGKKRKSDQISQPPPTVSINDFTDILDLLSDDEGLRVTVEQSPTKSPARSKLKTSPSKTRSQTPTMKLSPSKQRSNIASVVPLSKSQPIETSPCKTPRRNATLSNLEASKAKKNLWISDSDSVSGSDTGRVSKHDRKTSKVKKREERVIEDSDDEPLTPLAVKAPEGAIPRTASPAKRHPGSQRDDCLFIQNTPSKNCTVVMSHTITIAHSPQKKRRRERAENKPIELVDEAKAPQSIEHNPGSQTINSHSDKKLSAMLQQFLRQPSIMDIRRASLEEDLRQNREKFRKSLHEGSLELRERLRRDKVELAKQQTSLDVLFKEYRSYEELVAKKSALIARIADAYECDLNTDDDESHLQELDVLLTERQNVLKTYLSDAGINDPAQYDSQAAHKSHTNQSELIVQATQVTQPSAPPRLSRESSQVMGGSQIIMQTQAPSRADTRRLPTMKTRDFGFAAPVNSTPHPESDGMDYEGEDLFEAPNFLSAQNAPRVTRTAHQSHIAKTRRNQNKEALERGQYESDYSDDIDLAELAHEMETQQSSAENRAQKASRAVLSETSGNPGVRKEKAAVGKKRSATVAPIDPRHKKFPWYKDVKRALKERFRMNGFRHNQLEAINATLAAKDAFILMPTGGGKSLCYQLPAVVTSGKTSGITVVVSPLLSLMQDQVDHLKALNIAAATFNSATTAAAKKEIMSALKEPFPEHYFQLLYVTPEMIKQSMAFLDGLSCLYRNNKLARLVIDEAHCVSQWGHDFRPDYKQIGEFRDRFPKVPLMALTATATHNVIVDVKHNLGIDKCEQFTQSFNRPNLYYEVHRKEKDNIVTIANLINSKYDGKTGIVYTLSRKSAETIAGKLRDQGISSHHYHAKMEANEKMQIQRDWQHGKIKVVVATIAFGMGIDKPDVRFVIHQSLPKSLEGYYQETGRAGRDGKPSECYLYFNFGDVTQLRKLIADSEGNEDQKERQRNMLGVVTAFCDNQSDCRRVEILRYFGEAFTKAQCKGTCDNCRSKDQFEQKDFTDYALAALNVVRVQGRVTLIQCTDHLMGKKKLNSDDEIKKFYGIAKQVPKHEVHRIIDRLRAEEALGEENAVNKKVGMAIQYFKIGRMARSFLNGQRRLMLTTRTKSDGSSVGASKTQRRLDVPAAPATRKENTLQFSSTLVSSPARKHSGKKKGKAAAIYDDDSDEDPNTHINGYRRDGFVVGDDEHSDDGFETMARPVARRGRANPGGPPISQDARLREEDLTEVQKDILESFFTDVQSLEETIRVRNGFREPLFSQLHLREMGLRWTITLDQMRQIPGIKEAMVSRHGSKILPLIKQYHEQYQEIMGLSSEPRRLPHLGEIVDLVTSDDDDDDDDEDEENQGVEAIEDDEDEDGETSSYFQPSATEMAFMEKFQQANQQGGSSSSKTRDRSSSDSTGRGGKSNWRSGKKSYPSRRSSGGGGKFAGVKKKGTSSKRGTSGQASRGSGSSSMPAASKSKSGRAQGVGFDGIGLMDH